MIIIIPNECLKDKYTPLMWAAKNERVDIIKLLMSFENIDIDKRAGWVSNKLQYFESL